MKTILQTATGQAAVRMISTQSVAVRRPSPPRARSARSVRRPHAVRPGLGAGANAMGCGAAEEKFPAIRRLE